MRLENAVAADVLERILSAYGFTMQKQLSDRLGIAKSNVASWLQRGQVPGNVLVQCALDTGVDVQWLVTGVLANANMRTTVKSPKHSLFYGQSLITKMLQSGGKPVLQRIMQAYGFKTQKELSEYLEISTGTISTWVRRGFFPGDVVIACALDTGISLEWLATGIMNLTDTTGISNSLSLAYKTIGMKILRAGKLIDNGACVFDNKFIPDDIITPIFILGTEHSWIVDLSQNEISNGRWILEIDGNSDVYDVARIPGNRISITGKKYNFECNVENIIPVGLIFKTIISE